MKRMDFTPHTMEDNNGLPAYQNTADDDIAMEEKVQDMVSAYLDAQGR